MLRRRAVHDIEIHLNSALLAGGGHAQSAFDRALLSVLREERDLPVVKLWVAMAATLLPLALVLYIWGRPPWYLFVVQAGLVLYFSAPYILALHVSSHRQVFRPEYRWLQTVAVWLLGPFVGQTPETYRVHHMGMHHAEGNMPDDLSSTMPYQRDRWTHFAHYFLRFFFLIPVELGIYNARRGHWRMLQKMLVGEVSYIVALVALMFLNPLVTTFVFLLPLVFLRFALMSGNWAQHAFVDPEDPANPYKNSITFIDSPYNRRCFNDGFHIGHHVKPNRHWTEMPADFTRHLDKYAEEGAIVFRGIDYFQIWLLLMTRNHERLARHLVAWPGTDGSIEGRVALLRSRLRPIAS